MPLPFPFPSFFPFASSSLARAHTAHRRRSMRAFHLARAPCTKTRARTPRLERTGGARSARTPRRRKSSDAHCAPRTARLSRKLYAQRRRLLLVARPSVAVFNHGQDARATPCLITGKPALSEAEGMPVLRTRHRSPAACRRQDAYLAYNISRTAPSAGTPRRPDAAPASEQPRAGFGETGVPKPPSRGH